MPLPRSFTPEITPLTAVCCALVLLGASAAHLLTHDTPLVLSLSSLSSLSLSLSLLSLSILSLFDWRGRLGWIFPRGLIVLLPWAAFSRFPRRSSQRRLLLLQALVTSRCASRSSSACVRGNHAFAANFHVYRPLQSNERETNAIHGQLRQQTRISAATSSTCAHQQHEPCKPPVSTHAWCVLRSCTHN